MDRCEGVLGYPGAVYARAETEGRDRERASERQSMRVEAVSAFRRALAPGKIKKGSSQEE